MTNSESKYKNTAIKMNEALLELLNKKDFKDITVLELCKKAKVNRSTFYSHYENTNELLEETLNFVLKDFLNQFKNLDISNKSQKDLIFITPEFLVPYLEYIKSNSKIFMLYMKNLNLFKTNDIYNSFIHNLFTPIFVSYGISNINSIDYMSSFYLQGITAIVSKWLNNNCEDDTNYIVDIIIQCVKPFLANSK